MGPKLLHFRKGETTYSLRLFPIGGFCSMEGEDQSSENPNAFEKKAVWRRMLVVLAGAFMNLVLGFVLITVLLCTSTRNSVHSDCEVCGNDKLRRRNSHCFRERALRLAGGRQDHRH
ncbi:MAG: site-2 protease family protein [Ruminococcus sp.]